MKRSKFTIELLLTVVCLYLTYSLALKTDKTLDARLPEPYQLAAYAENNQSLQMLAEEEAQRMIETGDTSHFQEELEKHDLLMRVIGF